MVGAKRFIALLSITAIALGIAIACRGPRPVWPATLRAWGLPEDLALRISKIEILELPPSVTCIEWLPNSLVEVEAPGARIDNLARLPANLARLDLRYAEVSQFRGIPPSIEALDFRWATKRGSVDLTTSAHTSLRLLFVGGDSAELVRLPTELYTYGSFGGSFDGGNLLPESLRELFLQGPGVTTLHALPTSLTTLYLDATQVRDLREVPDTVTTLAVHETAMAIDRLPPYLAALSVTLPEVRLTIESFPSSLRELTVFGNTLAVSRDRLPSLNEGLLALKVQPADESFLEGTELPPYLERLDLTAFEGEHLAALPASLKDLGLAYSRVTNLGFLPTDLDRLDLSGLDPAVLETVSFPGWPLDSLEILVFHGFSGADFVPLPGHLRELNVSGSRQLVRLGHLPAGLERLDVSFTGLTSLPSNLPDSLRYLSIAGTSIDSVEDSLPHRLEELVLSPSQVLHLGVLPKSLRVLRFKGQS